MTLTESDLDEIEDRFERAFCAPVDVPTCCCAACTKTVAVSQLVAKVAVAEALIPRLIEELRWYVREPDEAQHQEEA